ncbi:lipoyltransferase [beta proteobacterium KB13]|uniref:Octanoyltransferase n=1 Tax=beta proteobacterium KB13 TaxID=314607 RepID=B6BW22_9PROT|nr:lipoyltransferase [beta proteobacterium KB13]
MSSKFKIKYFRIEDYNVIFEDMKEEIKKPLDINQFWTLEHYPVFTLGVNKKNIVLPDTKIPIISSDRGGKITYHGPGQVIIYTFINLDQFSMTITKLVRIFEESIIEFLSRFNISGKQQAGAPGVYVDLKKIASIGLRVKNNQTYHGISINNNMDLSPFSLIDPCGYKNLQMTQLKDLGIILDNKDVADKIITIIKNKLMEYEITRD